MRGLGQAISKLSAYAPPPYTSSTVDTSVNTVFRLPLDESSSGNRTDSVNGLVFTQRFSGTPVDAILDGSRHVAEFEGAQREVLESSHASIQTALAGDWSFMMRFRPTGGSGTGRTYLACWDGDVNEEIFRFRKGTSNTFAVSVNSGTNNATGLTFLSAPATNYSLVLNEWNWFEFRFNATTGLMRARMNDWVWNEATHPHGPLYSQASPVIPFIIGGTHDRNSLISPKDTKDEAFMDCSHVQFWDTVIADEVSDQVRLENAYVGA